MTSDNRYIGISGKRHDSISEAQASFYYAKFGFHACSDTYSHIFEDKEGTTFYAKADFYNADFGIYLEHKDGKLNSKTTKRTAEVALSRIEPWKMQRYSTYYQHEHGWNHSKKKQFIVQGKMTPQNMVICFAKPPTYKEAAEYVKAGIVFIAKESLPSYKAYCMFAKAGLAVNFRLNYTDDDGNEVIWEL